MIVISILVFRFRIGWAVALIVTSFLGKAHAATLDGRELFLDPRKGNCVACHQVPGVPSVKGKFRIGPELEGVKQRFPDRSQLRATIWDLSDSQPNTLMPPYGKHRILTETEIDAVVRYLETL